MQAGHKEPCISQIRSSLYQLRLRFRNMPVHNRGIILALCIFGCFLISKLLVYTFITDISYHTDSTNCPACYGTRMCKRIHETSVHGLEGYHHINKIFNVKNIYFGKLNNVELVFKKLAHSDELSTVDEYVCRGGFSRCMEHSTSNNKFCVIPTSQSYHVSCSIQHAITDMLPKIQGPLRVDEVLGLSDATQCPSPRLVKRMVHRYQERSDIVDEHGLSADEKFRLLYTLAVNPEPIILQMFPHGEKWPFPAYIGACGRMIAEDNAGVPLRDYFNSDWKTRVKLSLSLLNIADQLTDNSAGFKLYFSDISLDNYAVDKNTLEVTISDAENVVIVDEQHLTQVKPKGYNVAHHSLYDECEGGSSSCLTVDVVTLCSTTKSDFNYYALCKSLLSSTSSHDLGMEGGLLHSLPSTLPNSKTIRDLADQCARPPPNKDRFKIKDELISALEAVVESFSNRHKRI